MQQVVCNFCGSDSASHIHSLEDLRLRLPGQYTLVQCNRCGLLYLNPRPTWQELASHYPEHYHPFIGAIEDQPSALVRWAQSYGLRRRCRAITSRKSDGRLLDIGCATGVFLKEMRRRGGWELYGVEPVASAATFARTRFGLQIFQGTLLEAAYPDCFFDCVTMWDVLEHVDDPLAHLREISRILKPGGLLVLKVPDPSSWEAAVFGPFWIGYEAPQHLFGFPRCVLIRQLELLGFEIAHVGFLGSDYSAFMTSLGCWLEAHGRTRSGRVVQRAARSTAARVASAPIFGLARRLGLRSSLVYIGRKQAPVG